MKRPSRISTIAYLLSISIILVIASVSGYLWISSEYVAFRENLQAMEQRYQQERREQVQRRVDNILESITILRSQRELSLRRELKGRVEQACDIAGHLYSSNIGVRPEGEIQTTIRETLRAVHFLNDNGYYFIYTLDGVEELSGLPSGREGQNLLDLKDSQESNPIREMIALARGDEGGYLTYDGGKPFAGDDLHPKMAYVRLFEPYGWVLGTGIYLDEFEGDLKEQVLENIAHMRYDADSADYFFVVDYHDDNVLANDIHNAYEGRELSAVFNESAPQLCAQMHAAAARPEGGFVEYVWHRPGRSEPVPKVAFVRSLESWGWIIGASFHTDKIQMYLYEFREDLRQRLRNNIVRIVLVLGLIAAGVMFVVARFIHMVRRQFDVFLTFFTEALSTRSRVDRSRLSFLEFLVLSDSVNRLIDERERFEVQLLEKNRQIDAQRDRLEQLNTVLREKNEAFFTASIMDRLTGIYNRAYTLDALEKELSRSQRHARPLALVFFDIDHFKCINDTYGHLMGDQILSQVAALVRDHVRKEDVFGRYGGEEFLLVLPDTTCSEAFYLAEKIRTGIAQATFGPPEEPLSVTVSLGVAENREGCRLSAEELIRQADAAMYRAKQAGRNRTLCFSDGRGPCEDCPCSPEQAGGKP